MLNDVEDSFKSFDANIVLETFARMGTGMNQKPVAGSKYPALLIVMFSALPNIRLLCYATRLL
jgi:hypothetical protein